MTQERNETLPAAMSVLLALAAGDRPSRSASLAADDAQDDHGAEITLVMPRAEIGPLGRIRAPSVPPVSPIMPLPDSLSARQLLSRGQAVTMVACLAIFAGLLTLRLTTGIGLSPLDWAQLAVAAVTVLYIVVVSFRVLLVLAAPRASVIDFSHDDVQAIDDADLPVYTVLVPLYREEKVLRTLVDKLSDLSYPPSRLQILLLIEEDDELTRRALRRMALEDQFEVVVIAPRNPRTKPKACN